MKPTFIKIIKTLAVIALFGIILICLNLNMFSKRQSNFEEFIVEDKPSKREENVKYIFYYSNIFGGSWELVFGYGRQPFEKCEYSNCYLSMDNTKPIPFYKYSATIIHARDNCGPGAANGIRQNRGAIKGPFIYYLMESALYDCQFDFSLYDGIFNWTMGYHPHADVPLMYGNTYKVKGKQPAPNIPSILRKKNKLAFWIASHRWSLGKRDDYVELLKKYITVDKYGLFGPKNCPDSSNPVRIDCKKHFATYYKFYFAFENSLCQDYVTEKYFQALRLPVVPVVYGRVNYTAISPPHSFINVRDFKNPKALAEYLMYLDKNDTAYSEYFKWKLDGHYKISSFPQEVQKTLCNLCHKLNNLEHRPAYTTTQINKYWRGTKTDPVCSTPEDYIPGLK
ncbi:glycoprotein 3-alpha-L-fucosyltransferase A [Lepeophtheirus salmonis]|uniref:glycoprotein 3-alpha-L-fucosyltransferase A n=1 Tax=Lepeophtheirus salmonis TaxID=72036 RepID=UPI001AE4C8B1|nr:glycoprotein 3-alpha-L-fucosyltransferase A-like [Lepeophtheirus salmonis]